MVAVYAAIEQTVKVLILKEQDSLIEGRTVISLISQDIATSEMLEPGSHLTVVGINDCYSISVQHHRQIRVPHQAIAFQASVSG